MYNYDIRKRRLELGFTLEKVGRAVGVGKSTVRKWETGYIENMKRDKIVLIAKVLQITPSEFMGWETEQSPTKKETEMLEVYLRAKESDKIAVKALIAAIDKLLEIDRQDGDGKH